MPGDYASQMMSLAEEPQIAPVPTNQHSKFVQCLRAQWKIMVLFCLLVMWVGDYIKNFIFDIVSNHDTVVSLKSLLQLLGQNKTT